MNNVFVERKTTESGVWVALLENETSNINSSRTFYNELLGIFAEKTGICLMLSICLDKYNLEHVITEDSGIAIGRAFKNIMHRSKNIKCENEELSVCLIFDNLYKSTFISPISLFNPNEGKCREMYNEDINTFLEGFVQGAECQIDINVKHLTNNESLWKNVFSALGECIKESINKEGAPEKNFCDHLIFENDTSLPIRIKSDTGKGEIKISLSEETPANYRDCINTGAPFLNHMIEHIVWRSGFGINLDAVNLDFEKIGIALGKAFGCLITLCKGIGRGASQTALIDEAYAEVKLSFEGRSSFFLNIGQSLYIPSETEHILKEDLINFLKGFSKGANCTLVINLHSGENAHHIWEAIFRGLGEALNSCTYADTKFVGRSAGVAGKIVWNQHCSCNQTEIKNMFDKKKNKLLK